MTQPRPVLSGSRPALRWLVLAVGCASCAFPPHPPRPAPSSGIAADLATWPASTSAAERRGRSDHASFAGRDVPAVALFTGFHQDYHRVTDTVEKLDLPGLASIIDFTEAVVRSVGRVDESSVGR